MTLRIEKSLLYSSFNARALNPIDVANTFIPPPEFLRLTNSAHTMVVGPRGSGKTTLLKMLLQPAIESWEHELANDLRNNIAFTGVFIPTDVTLTSQLESAVEGLVGGEVIIRAAYSLHALRAVMASIEYRVGRIALDTKYPVRRVSMSEDKERELIDNISHVLQRRPRALSFSSFRTELASWLSDIFALARTLKLLNENRQQEILSESGLLRLDIIRTAVTAIDTFEGICGLHGEKWAILCDELELAPPVIVSDLFRMVRSTDERLLFKLSLSPYTAGKSRIDEILTGKQGQLSLRIGPSQSEMRIPPPEENEDFDTIRLWYPYKKEGFSFARQLAQSVISGRGFGEQTIEQILGHSVFDSPDVSRSRMGTVYSPGSTHNKRMKRLAEVDASFARYLKAKEIDLDERILSDDMRAKTLRKINGIVIVREAFRKQDGSRSRKNPTLYTGASAFFSICESNPRLLIGLMNQLLAGYDAPTKTSDESSLVRIAAIKQAEVYKSATARFRAYIRTIPLASLGPNRPRGLLSLIDSIGEYFHAEVVSKDFDDDPDTSFIVDSNVLPDLHDALQRALNAGAIIWVPDSSDGSLLTTLNGKRFRLSYLLAPFHQLPLQLGRAISLRRVLEKPIHKSPPLLNLFDEDES